ncbi:PKD domain-containing protein [Algoriphagus kandeliae]|uniref:PKD domain-containing protein n=1 Tax=Algoriphagus kandeliae TaxID=2562278 RepID=A0A4Y9QXN3_9BACT|nr:FG-GAP-like repeat-containing protein [Algoriphagus kandeliae]TFV97224.1 PKD domain-containing protein [Algoriphagus kandeliae]
MSRGKILLVILFFLFFENFATILVKSFQDQEINGGTFIDDYINFPTLDCEIDVDFTSDFSIQKTAQSPLKNVASFGTPIVGDVTGDGNAEVLILASSGTWNRTAGDELLYKTRNIQVYQYDGSNLNNTYTINTPFFINMEGPNPFLIARVIENENPFIIVAVSSSEPNPIYKSRLVAYQFNGAAFVQRWVSSDIYGRNVPAGTEVNVAPPAAPYEYRSGGAPGIADFDQDGISEVYIYNEIFNAETGEFLIDGGVGLGQGISQVSREGSFMYGGSISLSVAADITNSPGLELAAGNTVYNVSNSAGTWSMTPIQAGFNVNGSPAKDGFTSIADINNDGRLDVIVTTARERNVIDSRTVYVWNPTSSPQLIAWNTINDTPAPDSNPLDNQFESGTGVAFIGDIDGDLAPEIGVTSHKRLTMFRYNNPSTTLQVVPGYPQSTNDRSGYTLITMFDFNQDGEQELVYRDEQELRIIRGSDGTDLAKFPVYSATAGEGAVVADLDNDGEAEIVVTDAEIFDPTAGIGFPATPDAYLTVYETASDPWAPARPVWNQYGYFNVNILGDLSVPQNQLNHAIRAIDLFPNLDPADGCFPPNAQPLNSFLVQGTFYNDSGCRTANIPAFDVEIDNSSLFARRTCEPQSIEVNFSLKNNFTAQDIPADMEISFYREEADGTLTFLGEKITADRIITQADGWVDYIGVTFSSPLIPPTGDFNLVIIANNTGTVDSPDRLLECNYTNNTSLAVPVLDLPTFSIASSANNLCTPGNQLILTPITSDDQAVNPVKNWKRLAVSGQPEFIISGAASFPVSDPNFPTVTYTIDADEQLIVENLPEGTFSFVFDFIGCNLIEAVNEFSIDVSLIPSPIFVTQDATCFQANDGIISLQDTDEPNGITYTLISDSGIPVAGFSDVSDVAIGDVLFQNISPGTYRIRYFNQANATCIGESADLIITEPAPLEVIDLVSTPTTCGVVDNGAISLTLTGGTAPYSFVSASKDGSALGITPVISGVTYTFTSLESGNYEFIFEDANGCVVTRTELVGTTPVPDIDITVNPEYCFGETIILTPTIVEVGTLVDPVTYTWVAGGTPLTGTSGSFAGGTYLVSATTGITPPVLTLNNIDPNTYTFILQVRGAGSCDLDFSEDVQVNPLPEADFALGNVSCFGGSDGTLELIGVPVGSGPFSYELIQVSSGSIIQTVPDGNFSGLTAGDYQVRITNATTSCQFQTAVYTLIEPSEFEVLDIISTPTTCGVVDNGAISLTLTGGTAPYSFVSASKDGSALGITPVISGVTYTFTNLESDNYEFIFEDANGCVVTRTELVGTTPVPDIDITVNPEYCFGETIILTPTIVEVGTLVDPVTYTWVAGGTPLSSTSGSFAGGTYSVSSTTGITPPVLTLNNIDPNTYTFILQVRGVGSCDLDFSEDVQVNPLPEADFALGNVSCFGGNDGTLEVIGVPVGSGPFSYELIQVSSGSVIQTVPDGNFSGLTAGDYQVRITNTTTSCQFETPIYTLTESSPIEENQAVELPVSCGLDNGAIRDVLVTGGSGNYNFEWRKDDPTTGALLNQGTITGIEDLGLGTYYLIITDEFGCVEIFDYTIIAASDPLYELVDPINACFGEPIQITPIHIAPDPSLPPASATEIRWYKGPNQTELIQNGPDTNDPSIIYSIDDTDWLNPALQVENLPAGTHEFYFYVVCTGQEIKIDVDVYDTPEVTFESNAVSCFGELDGKILPISGTSSDYTYSIDGAPSVSQSELESFTFAAGVYSIQVNTPAGCPQIVDVEVEGPSGPLEIQVLSQQDPSCNLDNGQILLQLLGGNPDYTLTMNGAQISEFDLSQEGSEVLLENLAGGNYQFELSDQNGCPPAIITVTLTPLEVPEFYSQGDEICAFDPITGLANTGILSPITVNQAGSSPVFNWFYFNESGNEVQINSGDQVFGGTAVINSSGQLELTGVPSKEDPYLFYLEVSGDLVCSGPKIETELQVNFTPEVIFEKEDILCFGANTGRISVQSGGQTGLIFKLNTGETNDSGTFENLAAGNYTVEVSNGTSCIQIVEIQIEQPNELLISSVDFTDPTCDAINGEFIFTINGGVEPYLISINGEDLNATNFDFAENGGVYTVQNLAPGNYSISVIDANSCQVEEIDLFTLTNNTGVAINSNPIFEEICEGETAQLVPDITVPSGVQADLRWYRDASATQEIVSSSTPDSDGIVYQIDSQGVLSMENLPVGEFEYFLRISGDGICTQVTPATLTVTARPDITLNVEDISCFGANDGSVFVETGHDSSYLYTLNNGDSNSTGVFLDLIPGNYTLEVENTSGCIQFLNFEIREPEELVISAINFTNPTCDEENGEIIFEIAGGTGIYSVEINGQALNDTNFALIQTGNTYQIKGLAPDTYSVKVTDENDCVESVDDLFTLTNESGTLISSNDLFEEIMLGEVGILTPDLSVPAGVDYDLIWYFDSKATEKIISSPDPDTNGVVYLIDSNGVLSLENLSPGTYTYYYEISGDGICLTITEAVIVVKAPLSAEIITEPVTCFDGSDGSITLEDIVGGTAPVEFSLDQVNWQTSPKFENLTVGTYTVFVRDASIVSGILTSFENVEIITNATKIESNKPDIINAQCDLPNGAIRNLIISGGTGDYSIEWRKDDPISGDIQTSGTLTGIEDIFPGVYFLIITDSNGCQEVFEFLVDELPDPVYEIINPIDICLGETAIIKPVFVVPNPTQPTASTEVRWYKEPGQEGLISDGPDSEDPSIIYTIDDSDWVNPQLNIENLPAGTHDFYFYVVCTGQEIKVEVEVFEFPDAMFETSPVSCFGDSNGKIIPVSGILPEFTYSLNGGAPMNLEDLEALDLQSGIYSLDVINQAGCTQSLSIEIMGPESALTINDVIKIDPGCGADNGKIQAQITGGWDSYSVSLFKDGELINSITLSGSELIFDDLETGLYLFEVLDGKGCKVSSEEIELVDGPTQILVDNQEVCEGSEIRLIPQLDPPATDYEFLWFFDSETNQQIISSPSPDPSGIIYEISPEGVLIITGLPYSTLPYEFYVIAKGSDVCEGFVARTEVVVNQLPNATANLTQEICFGEGGLIEINATSGSGDYQFSIDGVNFQNSNVFSVQQGVYSVTIRTSQGCETILSDLEIKGPSAPINVQNLEINDATCGQDDGSISFMVLGGDPGYEIDLVLNSVIVSTVDSSDGVVSFSDLGIGDYEIIIRDALGCETIVDDVVQIQTIPTIIDVNDAAICEGESAVLIPSVPSASSDVQYSWYFDQQGNSIITPGDYGDVSYQIDSNGILTIQGLQASGQNYEYFVLATGSDVCRSTSEKAEVLVTGIPNLRVSNPSIVCDPTGTVDLTDYIEGYNPAVYDYNVVSPVGTIMRLEDISAVDLSGDYRVSSSVKGTSCWNQPQRIRVVIAETLLEADFSFLIDFGGGNIIEKEDIPLGEDVYFNDLTRGNAQKWDWDFGDGNTSTLQNPVHSYNKIGTYTVQLRVIDEIGCVSIYEMLVNVVDEFDVIVPNAFTPNGLKNQFFKPEFRGISSMEFYIFNTWGELIYQTNSLEDKGWDGTLNGKDAPNGNYVYRGRFVSRGGEVIEKSGVFILIR